MIIYGRNPVREALRGPRQVKNVWATKNAAREPWLAPLRVVAASAAEVQHRCGAEAHQGICAEVSAYGYVDAEDLLRREDPLILALDRVQDPQNLGAICRSAECAGVTGVVLPERRSASITPAVCKASAGAVEHLRIATVKNLADFLSSAKQHGGWVYGAAADGALAYDAVDYRGSVVLVLGSEGAGIRPRVAGACDALVSIPLLGRIQSLGVAAAAPVLLYAALRSRTTELQSPP